VSTRRPTVRRRLAAAACTPVLFVSLAACGSEGSQAEDASASSAPSDLASGDTVSADEFAGMLKSAVDNATTAHVSMDMQMGDMGSMQAEGDADYTATPLSMSMSMSVAGAGSADQKIDMVLVDNVLYMKPPAGAGAGDKYWMLDLSDTDNLPSGMGDMLGQMDPMKSMEEFGDALDEVTYQGTEDVDGETLDKYDVSVNTDELPQLSQMGQQVKLPATVDYDLYLDSDGLMRRLETDFKVMGQTLDISVSLDDWGQEVDITAPPKSQTTSFPGMTTAG
jgi:hypothetical protein